MKGIGSCNKVFLLYMRKAAGSTLRRVLGSLCSTRGLELEVGEGGPFDAARLVEPDTYFVTTIRDPVERTCSLYNFEGRWRQRDARRARIARPDVSSHPATPPQK